MRFARWSRAGAWALGACLASASLRAQDSEPVVVLSGRITDESGRGVEGVEILVAGIAGSVRTNADGRFRVSGVEPGMTTITARRLGFSPATKTAPLIAGDRSVELVLIPLPYRLAAVQVKKPAKFNRPDPRIEAFNRRRATGGGGSFVTRADIERIQARLMSDVLQLAPGFRTQRQTRGSGMRVVNSRGGPACRMRFYLDGLGVELINNDIDLLVRVQDVEAVEFYRGSSTLPVEFSAVDNRGDAGCGAIVVWTRQR